MLCSLRLSALPKKLYEAQVKGRPEDGDVLLATWVDLRGDPAAVSHYIVGLLLYHWDQDLLLVEHVQCTDSSKRRRMLDIQGRARQSKPTFLQLNKSRTTTCKDKPSSTRTETSLGR